MTPAIVRLDDLDAPAMAPVEIALINLAAVHHLPPYVKAYPSPTGVYLALTPATAEPWRAALAAPPYGRHDHENYSSFKTEVLWFGISVRLSYADY